MFMLPCRVWNRGDDRIKLIVLGPSLDDVRERAAARQAVADAERARCASRCTVRTSRRHVQL